MELFIQYLITGLVFSVSILLLYMKRMLTYWKRRNIPYLEPSIPFGNFENSITNTKSHGLYFKEFYDKFKKMGAKCGGIYAYVVPVFVPIDLEIIKLLLVKDFQHFHTRGFYTNERDQPVSVNLFTVDGERWRLLRTKFTPVFTSAKMKIMYELMVAASKTMEDHLREHARKKVPLDVKDCVGRMTANIIGSCAFGIECNSYNDSKFHKILKAIVLGGTAYIRILFCNALPDLARFLKIPLLPAKETNQLCDILDETLNYRKESNVLRNDFLQLVIEMKDKEIVNLTELKAQCILFFLAGFETSATTMTFVLFELACNQNIQHKLRKEINEVLVQHDNKMTYEAIANMKYLDMVILETLRKHPPVPFLNRVSVNDFQIPDSDMIVEKGTKIMFPVLGLHHDPEYFPEPNSFIPERFSDENKSKIPSYSFMPFGEGPRNCIGDRFGKQQVRVGIASAIRRYHFKLNSAFKFPLVYSTSIITSSKQDILLDVEEINSLF